MPARDDISVVCESLPVAGLLGTRKTRVTVLGGIVHRDELSCVGPVAAATVRRYHADVAVLGAAGLTLRHGITELFEEEAENHRLMIERSERLLLLADSTKLGAHAMAHVAPATAISTLVTDEGAPADVLAELRAAGVEVVIAQRPSTATRPQDTTRAQRKASRESLRWSAVTHDELEARMNALREIFDVDKPLIAMCHLPALPGRPRYDVAAGMERHRFQPGARHRSATRRWRGRPPVLQ